MIYLESEHCDASTYLNNVKFSLPGKTHISSQASMPLLSRFLSPTMLTPLQELSCIPSPGQKEKYFSMRTRPSSIKNIRWEGRLALFLACFIVWKPDCLGCSNRFFFWHQMFNALYLYGTFTSFFYMGWLLGLKSKLCACSKNIV